MVTAQYLNDQYRLGRPSNDIYQAGLLVHAFDSFDQQRGGSPLWLPCSVDWCAKFADRLSATIINAHLPKLYGEADAGYILNAMITPVFCSYFAECVPESTRGVPETLPRTCQRTKRSLPHMPKQLYSCV